MAVDPDLPASRWKQQAQAGVWRSLRPIPVQRRREARAKSLRRIDLKCLSKIAPSFPRDGAFNFALDESVGVSAAGGQ